MSETNADVSKDPVKKESNGTITFASEVISTIAGLAAIDIKGVAGMSGGFADGLVELWGRKNVSKGIKVDVSGEEVAVDVAVVVEYGNSIQQVAETIQTNVIKAVETMTGLKVTEVNVNIEGIKLNDQQRIDSGIKKQQLPKSDETESN